MPPLPVWPFSVRFRLHRQHHHHHHRYHHRYRPYQHHYFNETQGKMYAIYTMRVLRF